jgi:hypothetical protein
MGFLAGIHTPKSHMRPILSHWHVVVTLTKDMTAEWKYLYRAINSRNWWQNHWKWSLPTESKNVNPRKGINQQPTKFLKKKIGYRAARRSWDCTIVEQSTVGVVKNGGVQRIMDWFGPMNEGRSPVFLIGFNIVPVHGYLQMEPYRYGLRYGPLPRVASRQWWHPIKDERMSKDGLCHSLDLASSLISDPRSNTT